MSKETSKWRSREVKKKPSYLLREHRVVRRRRGAVALSASSAPASVVAASAASTAAQGLRASLRLLDRHSGVGLAERDVRVRRGQRGAECAGFLPGPRDRKDFEREGVADKGAL